MDLQNIDCMVEAFPLARANEAFSKLACTSSSGSDAYFTTLLQRPCWTEQSVSGLSS